MPDACSEPSGLPRRDVLRQGVAAAALLLSTPIIRYMKIAPAEGAPAPDPVTNGAVTAASFDEIVHVPPVFGAGDVTAPLNEWLASVPDGTSEQPTIVEFPRGSNYLCEGRITLVSRKYVFLRAAAGTGPKPTFSRTIPTSPQEPQWLIRNCDAVALVELDILGVRGMATPIETAQGEHGVWIMGSRSVVIADCTIRQSMHDNVYIGPLDRRNEPESDFLIPEHVFIVASTLQGAGRDNVAITHGRGIHVRGNALLDAKNTVLIEPGARNQIGVHGLTVVDNLIQGTRASVFTAHGESDFADFDFSNNRIEGVPFDFRVLVQEDGKRPRNIRVTGNVGDTVGGEPPIKVQRSDGVFVSANRRPLRTNSNGVPVAAGALLNDCTGFEVRHNHWFGADQVEIK
jgi:hypothetical protein